MESSLFYAFMDYLIGQHQKLVKAIHFHLFRLQFPVVLLPYSAAQRLRAGST